MKIIKSGKVKNPLVSVIVPTFNGSTFLDECLSSIKNQTFKNYEIIVSDAASEDNTIEIAKKYADKIVVSRKRGVAYQQNNGAYISRGRILVFVHQDVAVQPNYLGCVIEAFNDGYLLGKAAVDVRSNNFTLTTYFCFVNFIDTLFSRFGLFSGFGQFFVKRNILMRNKIRQDLYWDLDILKKIRTFGKVAFLNKTCVRPLDMVNMDGNYLYFRGKKVNFFKIIFIRYALLGFLSFFGFRFEH